MPHKVILGWSVDEAFKAWKASGQSYTHTLSHSRSVANTLKILRKDQEAWLKKRDIKYRAYSLNRDPRFLTSFTFPSVGDATLFKLRWGGDL